MDSWCVPHISLSSNGIAFLRLRRMCQVIPKIKMMRAITPPATPTPIATARPELEFDPPPPFPLLLFPFSPPLGAIELVESIITVDRDPLGSVVAENAEMVVRVPVSETLLPPWLFGVDTGVVDRGVVLSFVFWGLEVGDVDRDVRLVLLVCDSGVSVDVGVVEVGVVEVGAVDVVDEVGVSDVQGAKSVEMGTVKTCCSPETVTGTST